MQDMEDIDIVEGIQDVYRTTTGLKVDKRFKRFQTRTGEDVVRLELDRILSQNIFDRLSQSLKLEIQEEFQSLPGYLIRNPTLGIAAILYLKNFQELDAKDLDKFIKTIKNLNLSRADLIRYIRFVSGAKETFSQSED